MNNDLRCGNSPCNNFSPLRYYANKRPDKVPNGCIEMVSYTVLGTEKCNTPFGSCLAFQSMSIANTGHIFWWKDDGAGKVRCLENLECQKYYNHLAQSLSKKNKILEEDKI